MQNSNIELVTVESKAIKAIGWDHTSNQMLIKFADSPFYAYPRATRNLFDQFIKAESKGRFFQGMSEEVKSEFVCLNN
jgi:hypothetical protein